MSKPADDRTPDQAPKLEAPDTLIEAQDDLLRFAANADELAERIWNGQGTDLNYLIGDAIQSRDQQRAA